MLWLYDVGMQHIGRQHTYVCMQEKSAIFGWGRAKNRTWRKLTLCLVCYQSPNKYDCVSTVNETVRKCPGLTPQGKKGQNTTFPSWRTCLGPNSAN